MAGTHQNTEAFTSRQPQFYSCSRFNLWLLEALAAFCLGFNGPWIAMGDWNMEPSELAQTGWVSLVGGKVFAGGAGSLIDYFVVSAAIAHLVQQVKVIDESPQTPHWPVRLTRRRLFAVPHGGAF